MSTTTASDVVAAIVFDVAVSGAVSVTAARTGAFAEESFSDEEGRFDGEARVRGGEDIDATDGAELDWDEDDASTRIGGGSVVILPISLKGPCDGVGSGFELRFAVAEEFCS